MKSPSFIIGSSLVAGVLGTYSLQDTPEKIPTIHRTGNQGEKVSRLTRQATNRTLTSTSAFWGTSPIPFLAQTENDNISASYQEILERWLDQNITFKTRISNMTWYWGFYGGKISKETLLKNIRSAYAIEQLIIEHPGLLEEMQSSAWGKKYLNGELLPDVALGGNITAYIQLEKFEKENGDMYRKIAQTSVWNTGVNETDETILVDRRMILISMENRVQYVQEHPTVQERLIKLGLSTDNFYTDDWRIGLGVYGIIDAVYALENSENFPQGAWNAFWSSEVGQQYANGQIDPNEALEYMNSLINSSQENS